MAPAGILHDAAEERAPLDAVEVVCGRFHTMALIASDQAEYLREGETRWQRLVANPARSFWKSFMQW